MHTGHFKGGLPYILEELEAPEGYEKAEPVSFTVSEGGTVTVVRMYDRLKPEKPGRRHGQPEYQKKVIEELKEALFNSSCARVDLWRWENCSRRQTDEAASEDGIWRISHLGSRRCLSG